MSWNIFMVVTQCQRSRYCIGCIGVITHLEQLKLGAAIHTIEHLLAMQRHCLIFNILVTQNLGNWGEINPPAMPI